jgi:hypothetical protein
MVSFVESNYFDIAKHSQENTAIQCLEEGAFVEIDFSRDSCATYRIQGLADARIFFEESVPADAPNCSANEGKSPSHDPWGNMSDWTSDAFACSAYTCNGRVTIETLRFQYTDASSPAAI